MNQQQQGLAAHSDVIGGYRLRNLLQTGQSSQVYEVVELSSSRHFAMKILLPEATRDAEQKRFLFNDAEVGKQMAHPNVIRVTKLVKEGPTPFFVMEFFPSGSLRSRMLRGEHEFIKDNLHSILKQAATGLAYMNAKGWVHRDIKPDNMLVNATGELKLIDFAIAEKIPTGFAKWFWRKKKPQGTRSYMSPEQIRAEPLDGRADIYSYGCTVYELVVGKPPFRGKDQQELLQKHILEKPINPQVHNPEITDEFAKLILHTLAKKKEDRPKSFHDVLMTLNKIRLFKGVAKKK